MNHPHSRTRDRWQPRPKPRRAAFVLTGSLLAPFLVLLPIAGIAFALRANDARPGSERQLLHHAAVPQRENERYLYASPEFTAFVLDSYRQTPTQKIPEFYEWMSESYGKHGPRISGDADQDLGAEIENERQSLSKISDPEARSIEELKLGAWLHQWVKAIGPKFSLDRGFEFANLVRSGERQCFLQSIIIAGLLQAAGIDAGVVMVNRSMQGSESNNGHAVTLLKLTSGEDVLVDASEPTPFPSHQSLFINDLGPKRLRYVEPVFRSDNGRITGYASVPNRGRMETRRVRPLDRTFLKSQFDYYRGERTPGGLLCKPMTPEGLRTSAELLERSIHECPANPLPAYMLAKAYLAAGDNDRARAQIGNAYRQYAGIGWVPLNCRSAYEQMSKAATKTALNGRQAGR